MTSRHCALERLLLALALVLCGGSLDATWAQAVTVAKTGDRAPGTPNGVTFGSFYTPSLNAAGEVAFAAGLAGTGVNSGNARGIWVGRPGSLELVARQGHHAPGTPSGVLFAYLDFPSFNEAGEVAFAATLSGSGVTPANDRGVWVGPPGSLALLVRQGDHAPGTPAGVSFTFPSLPSLALNAAGEVVFRGRLSGSSVDSGNDYGIWVGRPGDLKLVAREGDQAPGTGANIRFSSFRYPRLNSAGEVAIGASLTGGTRPNDVGIWVGPPGALTLVARVGSPALSFADFVNMGDPSLSPAGEVAFWGVHDGANTNQDEGIWAGRRDSLAVVAREGMTSPPPGTPSGVKFGSFLYPGDFTVPAGLMFSGPLTGSVTAENDYGLWVGPRGGVQLVAREGDHAPGTPSGVHFGTEPFELCGLFAGAALNAAGEVAFISRLEGGGVTTSNNEGIWVGPVGSLELAMRKGDTLEVAPGDSRVVSVFEACNLSFSDAGQIVVIPRFADGTHALVVKPFGPPVAGRTTVDHTWQTVSLPLRLNDPIVIVGPPTSHGGEPGVVRLRNVAAMGFEARFQEWNYLDGVHSPEDLPYVVLERGHHPLPDGGVWEAGSFKLGGTGSWQTVSFSTVLAGPPAVFLTIQSSNGSEPVMVRARNVRPEGFQAALFEEEALMDGHAVETVGYLAIHRPLGSGWIDVGGVLTPYLLQSASVDHRLVPVLSSAVRLEGEQSQDPETDHVNDETVSVLALGPEVFAQVVSDHGGDTVALRRLAPEYDAPMEWGMVSAVDHNWKTVPLAKRYVNPVVIAKPASSHGSHAGVIRVRDVARGSFDMRYQEWLYLDGVHPNAEEVFYMVAEAGTFALAGLEVQAGRVETSLLQEQGWQAVQLRGKVPAAPAVFSTVMTFDGSDPVVTRIKDVTAQGFRLTMDEEEARRAGTHVSETLGWVAMSRSTGTTGDNRTIHVGTASVGDQPVATSFSFSPARRFPVVVADTMTASGPDPVSLRFQKLTATQIELHLQEEQSLDSEVSHATEEVSVLVAE